MTVTAGRATLVERVLPEAREIAACSLAGLLAGVIVASLGRIAMRVSGALSDPALIGVARTDNGNIIGDVTLGGTFALIMFSGVAGGSVGGFAYYLSRPALRWARGREGLAFGVALLGLSGATIFDAASFDFRLFGPPLLNVAMFVALFPLFGWLVQTLADRIERLAAEPRSAVAAGTVAAGLIATLGAVWTLTIFGVFGFIEPIREPPQIAGLLVVASVVVAALVRWTGRGPVGYWLLVPPLAFGSYLTLTAIVEILR